MFHFLIDLVQFFPFDSVMTAWFPDKGIDGKLKVVKSILEDMSNSVNGNGRVNRGEMDSGFRDDPIEDPRDRE